MSDVQFDEETEYQSRTQENEGSSLVRFVISTGLVSDKKSAEYVLLGFVVVGLLISVFLLTGGNSSGTPPSDKIPFQNGISTP